MAHFTFELGFDLCVAAVPTSGFLRYPLQWSLVNDNHQMVSPCHLDLVKTGDTLGFRVYNITQRQPLEPRYEPVSLQVPFQNATDPLSLLPFSPLQASQLGTTVFSPSSTASVAYGVGDGWTADLPAEPAPRITNAGRYNVRMLLTVSRPGSVARFYYLDPEMVVGEGATGG